jgi:excisionase family DNA binding protein
MPSNNQHLNEATDPVGNFDINKVAEHLSVHRSTVERLLHSGEFGRDWWRVGRKIIIPKENVFAYERREREKRLGTLAA